MGGRCLGMKWGVGVGALGGGGWGGGEVHHTMRGRFHIQYRRTHFIHSDKGKKRTCIAGSKFSLVFVLLFGLQSSALGFPISSEN